MKIKNFISFLFLFISDTLALTCAFYFSYWFRTKLLSGLFPTIFQTGFFPVSHFYKFWSILFIYILFFFYEKIYTKRYPFWVEFIYIMRAIFVATILISFFIYFTKAEKVFARTIIILMFFFGIFFVSLFRYITKFLLVKLKLFGKRIAIIAMKGSINFIADTLNAVWYLGYNIVGYIGKKFSRKLNYLGTFSDLKIIKEKNKIDGIIIMEEGFSNKKLMEVTNICEDIFSDIKFVPDSFGIKTIGVHPEWINEVLIFSIPNNLLSPVNRILKRAFDFLFALILSVVLLPFFLIIGILIKLDSKGPIFLLQERIGYRGRIFKFLKFRTMYVNNEEILKRFLKENPKARKEWEKYQKIKGYDPRVTRIGKFLRRFSLDELLQIFNVLLGDMSLVGPRPYLPREKDIIGKYYSIFFKVKPGLTGLWQIRGRNELPFKTRLKLDEFYVRNWSFFFDLMIIFKTFKVVLTGKGAY